MSRKGFLICLFSFIFLLLLGAVQPQIQCSAYNSTSNRYYLPNLGGRESVLNQMWLTSSPGVTYIFPVISSRISCSGTLKEVEFCYSVSSIANYGSNLLVFYLDFLSLNGVVFTVMERLDVYSSPDGTKCRNIQNSVHCCDIATLGEGIKLHLSMGSIAIGISIPPSSNVNLPGFHSTNYAQGYLLNGQPMFTQFEINPALRTSLALRLIWFHVEPDVMTELSTIQAVTPTSTHAISMSIQPTEAKSSTRMKGMLTTRNGVSILLPSSTAHVMSMSIQPMEAKSSTPIKGMLTTRNGESVNGGNSMSSSTNMLKLLTTPDRNNTSFRKSKKDNMERLAGIVGGSVGGLIALLIVLQIMLLLFLMFTKYQCQKPLQVENLGKSNNGLNGKRSTKGLIVTYANKAYSSVRHDEDNTAGDISEDMILTELNQAYTPSLPYNEQDPISEPPDFPIRVHANTAYNCKRQPTENTEEYTYADIDNT